MVPPGASRAQAFNGPQLSVGARSMAEQELLNGHQIALHKATVGCLEADRGQQQIDLSAIKVSLRSEALLLRVQDVLTP